MARVCETGKQNKYDQKNNSDYHKVIKFAQLQQHKDLFFKQKSVNITTQEQDLNWIQKFAKGNTEIKLRGQQQSKKWLEYIIKQSISSIKLSNPSQGNMRSVIISPGQLLLRQRKSKEDDFFSEETKQRLKKLQNIERQKQNEKINHQSINTTPSQTRKMNSLSQEEFYISNHQLSLTFSQTQRQRVLNLMQSQKVYSIVKKMNKVIISHLQQGQFRILGGGVCCSKSQHIEEDILNQNIQLCEIINSKEQKDSQFPGLDEEFLDQYKKLIIQKNKLIIQRTDYANAVNEIIDKCINSKKEFIVIQSKVYRSFMIEIFDKIIQYMIAGGNKYKQDEIEEEKINYKIEIFIDHLKSNCHLYPIKDFQFLAEFIQDLNNYYKFSDREFQQIQNQDKIQDFLELMVKDGVSFRTQIREDSLKNILREGKKLMKEIKQDAFDKQRVKSLIGQDHDKTKERINNDDIEYAIKQIVGLWVMRIEKFGQSNKINLADEVIFFADKFNQFSHQPMIAKHFLSYILIQVNYLLEIIELSALPKVQPSQLIIFLSNNRQFEQLVSILQQNFDQHPKEFIHFGQSDITHRFISNQILLKYNQLLFQQEQIIETYQTHLVYAYVTEKNESIKVLFSSDETFVHSLKEQIQNSHKEIAEKVIKYQLTRQYNQKQNEIEYKSQLVQIKDESDFLQKVSLNLIKKWELDQQRQLDTSIASEEDLQQELKDLYVDQYFLFLQGNNLFSKPSDTKSNEKNMKNENAHQQIMDDFLQQDVNNCENICKILAIIADGGTGKSMLLKKLETLLFLREKSISLSKNSLHRINNEELHKQNKEEISQSINQNSFLILTIQCSSLDVQNPSIEQYLKRDDFNNYLIQQLKELSIKKLILLDGYDEYKGEYFNVYSKLKLDEWKNTLVIITSRLEKISQSDALTYFSVNDTKGNPDDDSYSIVQLNKFNAQQIEEYYQKYNNKLIKNSSNNLNEEKQKKDNYQILKQLMNQKQFANLLSLPLNLSLFLKVVSNQEEIQKLEEVAKNISDQIQIFEIFCQDQFHREANHFICQNQLDLSDEVLKQGIVTSYFIFFQTIAMQILLLNKQRKLEKAQINFHLPDDIKQKIFKSEDLNKLIHNIYDYANQNVITKVTFIKNVQYQEFNDQNIIEFKHNDLYEYFVARAMKSDFDCYGENIHRINIDTLQLFNINKKTLMNPGRNQSEEQILLKFYQLLEPEIHNEDFYKSCSIDDISKTNKYIQYLMRSTINSITDISSIDVGSSNLISALFISRFAFPHLKFTKCSFSKAYIPLKKSNTLNFDQCNLQNAYIMKANLSSFETSFTDKTMFEYFNKEFDQNDIYSFTGIIFYEHNLISVTKSGYINCFKIKSQGHQLMKSKRITCVSLFAIDQIDSSLLVQSSYSLFQINPISFEIESSHKFSAKINHLSVFDKKYLITLENQCVYLGNMQSGFKRINILGTIPILNKHYIFSYHDNSILINSINKKIDKILKQITCNPFTLGVSDKQGRILIFIHNNSFSILNTEKELELINSNNKNNYNININNNNKDICNNNNDHTDLITSVAVSADGKYLATGSIDKTVKLWDIENAVYLIHTFNGHTSTIQSITFSQDRKYLASYSDDKTCRLWNIQKSFELISIIQGHTSSITSIAISTDCKYLATGSQDTTCKIWDIKQGYELIKTIEGHTLHVTSVAFSSNGLYLATGSRDCTCKIWNIQNGFQEIMTLKSHTNWIYSVAFSLNCKYLATGSRDKTCKIWNAEQGFGIVKNISSHTSSINTVSFSDNGKYLATGSNDKTCRIWNIEQDFEHVITIEGHKSLISSVAFSPDGRYLATGSQDSSCKLWRVDKGFQLIKTIQGQIEWISSVSFSANGKYLAIGSDDNSCKIWDIEKSFEYVTTILGHTDWICQIAFFADGKYLATCSQDASFKIWNVEKTFSSISSIQGHTQSILYAAFSPDGKYLATGSLDTTCKIWSVNKGFQLIKTIRGHTFSIKSIAFSSDARYVATVSEDACNIWNAENGFEFINAIHGHTSQINSVAFSPNENKYFATGSDDNSCKIWDSLNTFELLKTLEGHKDWIRQVTFSENGKLLATVSNDTTCKIWNVLKEFELIITIEGHSSTVYSVAFSADGKYLATGSDDKTCKVWDAQKEFQLINTISDHTSSINSVAFNQEGNFLVTGSYDSTSKIWDISNEQKLVNTIQSNSDWIRSVNFSKNGKYLVIATNNATVQVWNAYKKLEIITAILKHTDKVHSISCSAEGDLIIHNQNDKKDDTEILSQKNILLIENILNEIFEI